MYLRLRTAPDPKADQTAEDEEPFEVRGDGAEDTVKQDPAGAQQQGLYRGGHDGKCYVVTISVCTGEDMMVNVMWLVLGSVQGRTWW